MLREHVFQGLEADVVTLEAMENGRPCVTNIGMNLGIGVFYHLFILDNISHNCI